MKETVGERCIVDRTGQQKRADHASQEHEGFITLLKRCPFRKKRGKMRKQRLESLGIRWGSVFAAILR